MRKGEATRERILEVAEASVLAKGFGARSIEEVIAEAGITKSGFFIISGTRTNSPTTCCVAMWPKTSASSMRFSVALPNYPKIRCNRS